MSERRNHYYIDGSTVRKLDYSAEPVRREYEPARRTEMPAERPARRRQEYENSSAASLPECAARSERLYFMKSIRELQKGMAFSMNMEGRSLYSFLCWRRDFLPEISVNTTGISTTKNDLHLQQRLIM